MESGAEDDTGLTSTINIAFIQTNLSPNAMSIFYFFAMSREYTKNLFYSLISKNFYNYTILYALISLSLLCLMNPSPVVGKVC